MTQVILHRVALVGIVLMGPKALGGTQMPGFSSHAIGPFTRTPYDQDKESSTTPWLLVVVIAAKVLDQGLIFRLIQQRLSKHVLEFQHGNVHGKGKRQVFVRLGCPRTNPLETCPRSNHSETRCPRWTVVVACCGWLRGGLVVVDHPGRQQVRGDGPTAIGSKGSKQCMFHIRGTRIAFAEQINSRYIGEWYSCLQGGSSLALLWWWCLWFVE